MCYIYYAVMYDPDFAQWIWENYHVCSQRAWGIKQLVKVTHLLGFAYEVHSIGSAVCLTIVLQVGLWPPTQAICRMAIYLFDMCLIALGVKAVLVFAPVALVCVVQSRRKTASMKQWKIHIELKGVCDICHCKVGRKKDGSRRRLYGFMLFISYWPRLR